MPPQYCLTGAPPPPALELAAAARRSCCCWSYCCSGAEVVPPVGERGDVRESVSAFCISTRSSRMHQPRVSSADRAPPKPRPRDLLACAAAARRGSEQVTTIFFPSPSHFWFFSSEKRGGDRAPPLPALYLRPIYLSSSLTASPTAPPEEVESACLVSCPCGDWRHAASFPLMLPFRSLSRSDFLSDSNPYLPIYTLIYPSHQSFQFPLTSPQI